MTHVIDDGAVFYINGEEIDRFNLDDGEVAADTLANGSVTNAKRSEPLNIPVSLFVAGTNTISAEVHQRTVSSSDIVFGIELMAGTITDPGTAPTPYSDNDEEWIEIFNKEINRST